MVDHKEKFSGKKGVFLYLQEKLEECPELEGGITISYHTFRSESITTGVTLERIWKALKPLSKKVKPEAVQIEDAYQHGAPLPLCFHMPEVGFYWQISFGEMKYSEFSDMKNIFGSKFSDPETTNFERLSFSWKDRDKFKNWLAEKAQTPEKMTKDLIKYMPNYLLINGNQISLGKDQNNLCKFLLSQQDNFSAEEADAEEFIYGDWQVGKYSKIKELVKEINKKTKPILGRKLLEYKNKTVRLIF